MRGHIKSNLTDWTFGVLMFAFCAILTLLQYRWTGEVANAEMVQVRGDIEEKARAVAGAFDKELLSNSDQLLTGAAEFASTEENTEPFKGFQSWQHSNPDSIIKQVGIAVQRRNGVELLVYDGKQLLLTNWPERWEALRENFEAKHDGGSGPYNDSMGSLFEFPVFGGDSRREDGPPDKPAGERWLIVELDLRFLRNSWFPAAIKKYLSAEGQNISDVRVQTIGPSKEIIYSQYANQPPLETPPISIRFNTQGRSAQNSRGPISSGKWMLETWPRQSALVALVAKGRFRNLAVAFIVNALMLTTGIVLLRHMRRSRKLAEQQMRFVATTSHELRTPLTVIRGAAHNLQRGIIHERAQIKDYSTLIINHTDQLRDMVEQMLELAGATKNRATLSLKPISLTEILKKAVVGTDEDVRSAKCKLELNVPCDLPPVLGDESQLQRVFQNLISNAAKHGADGGWIGIKARPVEEKNSLFIEIEVSDRGLGVPPGEQKEIFKPFVRGSRAEARLVRGSGLGLSLVRDIVEQHKGSISLSSKLDEGAVFSVRLPALGNSSA